jgi:hypothetical protein
LEDIMPRILIALLITVVLSSSPAIAAEYQPSLFVLQVQSWCKVGDCDVSNFQQVGPVNEVVYTPTTKGLISIPKNAAYGPEFGKLRLTSYVMTDEGLKFSSVDPSLYEVMIWNDVHWALFRVERAD